MGIPPFFFLGFFSFTPPVQNIRCIIILESQTLDIKNIFHDDSNDTDLVLWLMIFFFIGWSNVEKFNFLKNLHTSHFDIWCRNLLTCGLIFKISTERMQR